MAQLRYGATTFTILGIMLALSAEASPAIAQGNTIMAWDLGTTSPDALSVESIATKPGWKPIASGEKMPTFHGDAAVSNGRFLAVARKRSTGLELYSLGPGKWNLRTRLLLAPGKREAPAIERIALTEHTRTYVDLEIETRLGRARYRIKKGDIFVETQSLIGTAPLRVECDGRFAILPDFFADDIVFDARKLPVDRVEVPSENFLLQPTGFGNTIVMSVFEHRNQDVRLTLAKGGPGRVFTGSEIDFGKKGNKIWVAVIDAPGVWHDTQVGPNDVDRILAQQWKMPFPAQWRVNFTRHDGLTDSWDMLLPEEKGDGYIKPSWLTQDGRFSPANRTKSGEIDHDAYRVGWIGSNRLDAERNRWTTVLDWFHYPCWSDRAGKVFLQPFKHPRLSFNGPVVIYPLTRLPETPITQYTPLDVMRSTLGVGPCEHLLDVEGQQQQHVGRATCHVWRLLVDIYSSGQQKEKSKEVTVYLSDAHDFITHIRKRIVLYQEFGKDMRNYLAEQRKAHPEWKTKLDELDVLAREIDERVQPRMRAILQEPRLKVIAAQMSKRKEEPTPPALAAQLNRDFLANGLLGYDGKDWQTRLDKEYTDPLTKIGEEQDEMVGECRWVVKALRQKAGILLATDPQMAGVANEIRARTQKMLRGGAAYEGARH